MVLRKQLVLLIGVRIYPDPYDGRLIPHNLGHMVLRKQLVLLIGVRINPDPPPPISP
jgi:hypothetical protein